MEQTIEEVLKEYDRFIKGTAFKLNQPDNFKDLIQEGKIALFKAYSTFDESKGPVHPYFMLCIRGGMMNFLTKHGRTIYLPDKIVMKELKKEEKTYKPTISMDIKINSDGDSLYDIIPDTEFDETIDDEELALKNKIKKALHKLPETQREVIILFYGIDKDESLNMRKIGDLLGITRQSVFSRLEIGMRNIKKYL